MTVDKRDYGTAQATASIKYNNVKAFFALCEQSKKRFCSIKFEHGKECFLRHLDRTDLFHALLAFFLLFEQFTLSGYVAAVAFGRHILADGLDGFTCDDFRANGSLDSDVELLASGAAVSGI